MTVNSLSDFEFLPKNQEIGHMYIFFLLLLIEIQHLVKLEYRFFVSNN